MVAGETAVGIFSPEKAMLGRRKKVQAVGGDVLFLVV
jgi:hypothetical protein